MGTCCGSNDNATEVPEHVQVIKSRPQPKRTSKSQQETYELQQVDAITNHININETNSQEEEVHIKDDEKYDIPSTVLKGLTRKDAVDDVLVAIIGIDEYLAETGLDPNELKLKHVENDINNMTALWNDSFKYKTRILSGKNDQNKRNNRYIFLRDVKDFLKRIRSDFEAFKDENETILKYNALILLVFGHGINESLVTSEGGLVSFDYIRQLGSDGLVSNHIAHSIRFFIFNVCRGGNPAQIKPIRPAGRGVNDIAVWKPTEINSYCNICTLYSVPKGFIAPDHEGFTQQIQKAFTDDTNLKDYTLDEICMIVKKDIAGVNEQWCPEYSGHDAFKIKLKKSTKQRKPIYFPLQGSSLTRVKNIFLKPEEMEVGHGCFRGLFQMLCRTIKKFFNSSKNNLDENRYLAKNN